MSETPDLEQHREIQKEEIYKWMQASKGGENQRRFLSRQAKNEGCIDSKSMMMSKLKYRSSINMSLSMVNPYF
jgi:hypothetical protein